MEQLNVTQTAALLDVDTQTVINMANAGKLDPARIDKDPKGRKIRFFNKADVEALKEIRAARKAGGGESTGATEVKATPVQNGLGTKLVSVYDLAKQYHCSDSHIRKVIHAAGIEPVAKLPSSNCSLFDFAVVGTLDYAKKPRGQRPGGAAANKPSAMLNLVAQVRAFDKLCAEVQASLKPLGLTTVSISADQITAK